MTQHTTSFEIERPVSANDAVAIAVPGPAATPVPAKKLNFRKMLLTGVALAALAGAAWYGWDYWTVGQYLVSTDDAYVQADNTTIAPKVSGYLHEVLVGDNERGQGRPDRWRGSTIATSRSRSTRPRPTSPPPKPRSRASRRSSRCSRR